MIPAESSSDNLQKVCAVIDAQGYSLGGVFYPRMFAINNGKKLIPHEFRPVWSGEEISPFSKTINYQFNYVHGYAKRCSDHAIPSEHFVSVIQVLYEQVKDYQHPYLAVANDHLKRIMERTSIPFIDLTKGTVCPPAHKKLDVKYQTDYWLCQAHTPNHRNDKLTCALRKVDNLWRWIEEAKHMDNLISTASKRIKRSKYFPEVTTNQAGEEWPAQVTSQAPNSDQSMNEDGTPSLVIME